MNETADDIKMPDELQVLKDRARLMGITHSNNIGLEALRKKIADHQTSKEGSDQPLNHGSAEDAANLANPLSGEAATTRPLTLRERLLRDEMKLVRCIVTNLNQNKKDLPGEIYTVANDYLGTVRKYIPYGAEWHIPHVLFTMLKEKSYLSIRTTKDARGQPVVKYSMTPEFSIEVLPPLTQDEIVKLAAVQKSAGILENPNEEQF